GSALPPENTRSPVWLSERSEEPDAECLPPPILHTALPAARAHRIQPQPIARIRDAKPERHGADDWIGDIGGKSYVAASFTNVWGLVRQRSVDVEKLVRIQHHMAEIHQAIVTDWISEKSLRLLQFTRLGFSSPAETKCVRE